MMRVLWIFAAFIFAAVSKVQCEDVYGQAMLLCHPQSDKDRLLELHRDCERENKDFLPHKYKYKCYKACMLQEFGAIYTKDSGADGYPVKVSAKPPPDDLTGFMYQLMNYLGYREEILRTLCNKVVHNCSKETIPINEQKLPCDKWDNLYACVENALKC